METTTADQTGIVVVGSVQRPSLAVFQNSIFVAGVGPNTATTLGAPQTGDAETLWSRDPDTGEISPEGQVDDAGPLGPPPPLEPKGIFYFNFDGQVPSLPILLFPDRASETPVTQAVYADVPVSLKDVMLRHGFDPSKGVNEFIREFKLIWAIPLRALLGF